MDYCKFLCLFIASCIFFSKYRVLRCLCKNGIVLHLYFSLYEKLTTHFSGFLKSCALCSIFFWQGKHSVIFLCFSALRLKLVHRFSLRSFKVLRVHISRALAMSMYISISITFKHTRCARSSISDWSAVRLQWKETLQYSRQLCIKSLYMVNKSSVLVPTYLSLVTRGIRVKAFLIISWECKSCDKSLVIQTPRSFMASICSTFVLPSVNLVVK